MPLNITNSQDISSLDSKIVVNTKDGKFYIDVTPSVFIGSGAAYVDGASVKVVNPLGVVIQDYTTSGYDINPPMTGVASVNIPKVAGVYFWGTYKITVRLTDNVGNDYELEKSVNICQVDKDNKNKNSVCINAKLEGDCVDGKLIVSLNGIPNYKAKVSQSQLNDLTLYYPTESQLPPLDTVTGTFSVQLYEGEYKLTGDVLALYDYGDNVFYYIKYDVKCSKIIKCNIDECCIYSQLEELNLKLQSDCSNSEKEETQSRIFDTLRLLKTIKLAANCGKDPSNYILELEELLGCSCTCNCNDGTPVINNSPVTDFTFEGCGFDEETVGLTKVITINNYAYESVLSETDATGVLEISAPELDSNACKVVQQFSVSAAAILDIVEGAIGTTPKILKITTNQTGTNDPVVTTLVNTTGVTWTPSYVGAGEYLLTANDPVMPVEAKTFVLSGYQLADSPMHVTWLSSTQISIRSDANGRLDNTAILIEIYP
jgi:hypothetical protein